MIWLAIFVLPVLALLYVTYLMLKAVFVVIIVLFRSAHKPTIGELDPVTDRVKWR